MSSILVLPGDGIGPIMMDAVAEVLRMSTDGIELVYGDVGQRSYEKTGHFLSHETADLMDLHHEILCGPTANVDNKERTMDAIKMQMGLYAKKRFFKALMPELGVKGLEYTVWSSNYTSEWDVKEVPELDGITMSKYIKATRYGMVMTLALSEIELRKQTRISCVTGDTLFPKSSAMFKDSFDTVFPDDIYEKRTEDVSNWIYHILHNPFQDQCAIVTDIYANVAESVICGLTGYNHLYPEIFFGNDCEFIETSGSAFPENLETKYVNPTSAILGLTEILWRQGHTDEAEIINKALEETYAAGERTPDVGGTLTTQEFIEKLTSRF